MLVNAFPFPWSKWSCLEEDSCLSHHSSHLIWMELLFLHLKPQDIGLRGTAWEAAVEDPRKAAWSAAAVFFSWTCYTSFDYLVRKEAITRDRNQWITPIRRDRRPKRNENVCPQKSLHMNVYSSFIYNHPKPNVLSVWRNTHTLAHPHRGIQLRTKLRTHTVPGMHASQMRRAQQRRDAKAPYCMILFIYYLGKGETITAESRGCQGWGWRPDVTTKGSAGEPAGWWNGSAFWLWWWRTTLVKLIRLYKKKKKIEFYCMWI